MKCLSKVLHAPELCTLKSMPRHLRAAIPFEEEADKQFMHTPSLNTSAEEFAAYANGLVLGRQARLGLRWESKSSGINLLKAWMGILLT